MCSLERTDSPPGLTQSESESQSFAPVTIDRSCREPPAKRQKRSIEDDLLCPITLELPFDPVTAEDGRVYERSAIHKYFSTKPGSKIKSPYTNESIGKKLVPSPQFKNIIETSIENGHISEDQTEKWRAKVREKEYMEHLRRKAEGGDAEAMRTLGFNYRYGKWGLAQNHKTAFSWMEKAHKAGSLRGTTAMGEMLVKGYGVNKDERKGSYYLTIAAGKGSSYAAYWVGMALADGKYGMHVDKDEAKQWLTQAVGGNCSIDNLSDHGAKKARKKLKDLTGILEEDDMITSL